MHARSTCGARPYKQILDVGCYSDNEELCDHVFYALKTQLMHENIQFVLNDMYGVSTHIQCIASNKEVLKLMSSCLRENHKSNFGLPSFYHYLLNRIDKHDKKGEYYVHPLCLL